MNEHRCIRVNEKMPGFEGADEESRQPEQESERSAIQAVITMNHKEAMDHNFESKHLTWNNQDSTRGCRRTPKYWSVTLAASWCALLQAFVVEKSNAFSTVGYMDYRPSRNIIRHAAALYPRTAVQSSRDYLTEGRSNDEEDSLPSLHTNTSEEASGNSNFLQSFLALIKKYNESFKHRPPPDVEDTSVLLYDVFLLINLTASVSFWVVHRMDVSFIAPAISEGALLSILWVTSGLASGAFLYSAVDGHRPDGGPRYASMLALNTFVNAMNLRLLFALGAAVLDHRPVGSGLGEDLIGLELGFGLVLMTAWRALHSKFVPRM